MNMYIEIETERRKEANKRLPKDERWKLPVEHYNRKPSNRRARHHTQSDFSTE